jgi:phosphoserine phosphatase
MSEPSLPAPSRSWKHYRLLAMDMDSTLIRIECIDEIGQAAGKGAEITAITEATMRGEIPDFETSLRQRVALLAGLPESALLQVYQQRCELSPGAEALITHAHATGLQTLLVSGGFTFFTQQLQQKLGLHFAYSNELEIQNGRLTGRVIGPIIDGPAKRRLLLETCAPQQVIAIGDGANDIPMLQTAGLAVAYHAKPILQQHAHFCINAGGLDTLLQHLS